MLEIHPYSFVVLLSAALLLGFAAGLGALCVVWRRASDQLSQTTKAMHECNQEYQSGLGTLGKAMTASASILEEELKFAHGRYWRATALLMGANISPKNVSKAMASVGLVDLPPISPSAPLRTPREEAALAKRKQIEKDFGRGAGGSG